MRVKELLCKKWERGKRKVRPGAKPQDPAGRGDAVIPSAQWRLLKNVYPPYLWFLRFSERGASTPRLESLHSTRMMLALIGISPNHRGIRIRVIALQDVTREIFVFYYW